MAYISPDYRTRTRTERALKPGVASLTATALLSGPVCIKRYRIIDTLFNHCDSGFERIIIYNEIMKFASS